MIPAKKAIIKVAIVCLAIAAGSLLFDGRPEAADRNEQITFDCGDRKNFSRDGYEAHCLAKKEGNQNEGYVKGLAFLSTPLPADSLSPAAGACAYPSETNVIRVEVSADAPSPQCQKVFARKQLAVKNNTDRELSLWFGEQKDVSLKIPAQEELLIPKVLGKFLGDGVHVLHGEPYQGPEIWMTTETTPYLYQFGDHLVPEEDMFAGTPADVSFGAFPQAKNSAAQIENGARFGPNFAGHYTVTEWGCGTSCQTYAIVEVKTGAIIHYGDLKSVIGAEYRLDSSLLVINPPSHRKKTEKNLLPSGDAATEYYALIGGRLIFLDRQLPGEKTAAAVDR